LVKLRGVRFNLKVAAVELRVDAIFDEPASTIARQRIRSHGAVALRPFPEAARAVGAALHQLESDAAKDITPRAAKAPLVIDATLAMPPCVPLPPAAPC
jgi:hypothetical protein